VRERYGEIWRERERERERAQGRWRESKVDKVKLVL